MGFSNLIYIHIILNKEPSFFQFPSVLCEFLSLKQRSRHTDGPDGLERFGNHMCICRLAQKTEVEVSAKIINVCHFVCTLVG